MPRKSETILQHLLEDIRSQSPSFHALLESSATDQRQRGYFHTLREISQQPLTWEDTTRRVIRHRETMKKALAGINQEPKGSMLLTGSGSSFYVGACLAPLLQKELAIPVRAIPAGALLLDSRAHLVPNHKALVVSLARSGDSPESSGVVDSLLDTHPDCRHLAITCNPKGRLAIGYSKEPRVSTVVLDEITCDQSLVMTSSFTNLLLATRFLGMLEDKLAYQRLGRALSNLGLQILKGHSERLAEVAETEFRSVVFLGSGPRYAAAREGALKMLEMTAGKVTTLAESYLGLRHGPMSAIHPQTLIVGFLASEPLQRLYEIDLIEELNRKKIGAGKVLLGETIPLSLVGDGDYALALPGMEAVTDENTTVIDVLVSQLLSFFRCLRLGLKPDRPSPDDVIRRVVETFRIHKRTE